MSTSRRLLIMLAILISSVAPAGLMVPTTSASAVTPLAYQYIEEITYYSDSTYTVQVGYYYRNCQGFVIRSGQVTPYAEGSQEPCG